MTEQRLISNAFFYGDDIGSSFFEQAINELQEDKKSLVNEMFKETEKENFADFLGSLDKKMESQQRQIDYYKQELENGKRDGYSEEQMTDIKNRYNNAENSYQSLFQIKNEYEERLDHPYLYTEDNYGNKTITDDSYARLRYSFDNKDEYESFASAMYEQNIYVNTSSAEVNGNYILEICKKDQQKAEIFANNQNFHMENKSDFYSYTPESYFSRGNGDRTEKGMEYDNYGVVYGIGSNTVAGQFKDTTLSDADFNDISRGLNEADKAIHEIQRMVSISEAMEQNGGELTNNLNVFNKYSNETKTMLDTFKVEKNENGELVGKGTLKNNASILEELDKKYHTDLRTSGLTTDKMIHINSEFIKRHKELIINEKGKVDFTHLAALSDTQLKVYGISKAERDFVLSSHKALSLNGQVNYGIMGNWGMSVLAKMKKTMNEAGIESDEDLEQLKNSSRQITEGSKRIYQKEKDFEKIIKERRERRGIKKAQGHNKKAVSNAGKRAGTPLKKFDNKKATEKMAERISKNYKRKMVAKMNEKFTFAQNIQAFQMNVASKVGSTGIAKVISGAASAVSKFVTGVLIPCIAIAVSLFIAIIATIFVVAIVVTGITDLFNFYTGESVVKAMADTLAKEEEAWYEHITDTDRLWEQRENLLYGDKYMSFDQYVGANNNTSTRTQVKYMYRTNNGNMYICPWINHSVTIADYCKDITQDGFDGGYTFEVDTNWNLGTTTTVDSQGNRVVNLAEGYWSSKSGHTSNIKDILSMANVMFGFDEPSASDDRIQSITGSPFAMDWADFKSKMQVGAKFMGASFSSIWDGEQAFIEFEDETRNRTVSYATLQIYCMGLFEASHQEKIKWEVVFLPMHEGDPIVYGEDNSYLRNNENIALNGDLKEVCPGAADGGCMQTNLYCFATNSGGYISYGGLGFKDASDGCYYGGSENCLVPISVDNPGENCIPSTGMPDGTTEISIASSPCWEKVEDRVVIWDDCSYFDVNKYSFSMGNGREGDSNALYFYVNELVEDGVFEHAEGSGYSYQCWTETDPETGETITHHEGICEQPKYDLVRTAYVHRCKGHSCHLCGGHLVANVHGFVYSMTDEQWFSFTNEGVGADYEIQGKILPENIPYETRDLRQIAGAGQNTEETYVGGLNLNVNSSGTWDIGNKFNPNKLLLAQDIFDIDLAIDYGSLQFPISSYTQYEGWTRDNMTFAVAKASANWDDYYGFDIPTNMGVRQLSQKDIDTIVYYVEETYKGYGKPLSEERVTAITTALQSVGKGNYSQLHHAHAYRSHLCQGHECNKTDCSGFASYCVNQAKGTDYVLTTSGFLGMGTNGTFSDRFPREILPGDILIKDDGTKHAVVYIGTIDFTAIENDVFNGGSNDFEMELESGGKIGGLMPITVDCTTLDGYGNIYMRNCYTDDFQPDMSYLNSMKVIPLDNM